MTGRATLPGFVSQVCQTVASFDRPTLELSPGLGSGRFPLIAVSSTSRAKVETVCQMARAAGLRVHTVDRDGRVMAITAPWESAS